MPNIDPQLDAIMTAIYGEDVRGSIHDALQKMNNNIDSSSQQALRQSIAEAWVGGHAYSKDDYVWYTDRQGSTAYNSGLLYRAKQDIPVSELTWVSSHWEQVLESDEIYRNADDIIKVQNTQPTEKINRIWIKDRESEVQVPTWDEFEGVTRSYGRRCVSSSGNLQYKLYGLDNHGAINSNTRRCHSCAFDSRPGDVVRITGNYLCSVDIYDTGWNLIASSYWDLGDKWFWNDSYTIQTEGYAVIILAHSDDGTESSPSFQNSFTNEEMTEIASNQNAKIYTIRSDKTYEYPISFSIDQGYYLYAKNDSPSKGYIRTYEGCMITDFIPVYEGMRLLINTTTGSGESSVFGYNASRTPVDNLVYAAEKSSVRYSMIENELVIPSGVSYIRLGGISGCTIQVLTDTDGMSYINKMRQVPDNATELFVNDVAIGSLTGGQGDSVLSPVSTSSSYYMYRLSSNFILGLPFGNKTKILVRMKDSNYKFGMNFGDYSNHMDMESPWCSDGDIIDIQTITKTTYTDHPNYYMFTLGFPIYQKNPGTTSSTAKQMELSDLEKCGLKLYAINDDICAADNGLNLLSASKITKVLYGADSRRYSNTESPVIFHTSDPHGDYRRVERFFDSAEKAGADIAAVTGDIVTYNTYSGLKWFHEIVNDHNVLPAICTGNHDVYIPSQTDAQVYQRMFYPIKDKLGMTSDKTYYVKDLADKKLRMISLDMYQFDGQSTAATRSKPHINQDQLDWFISTLESTPSGYGVIVLVHSPFAKPVISGVDEECTKFFQKYADRRIGDDDYNGSISGEPFYDIIDAFISRGTVSRSYTQNGSPSTISANASFSDIDASIEFIAFLSGHIHQDRTTYVQGRTNMQLELNVIGTLPYYGNQYYSYLMDDTDVGRETSGMPQDAFNAYVIDRTQKIVKVTRIGADTTLHMEKRDYMEIPYKEWNYTEAVIENGSVTNPASTSAVYTETYIPVANGNVVRCKVNDPVGDGYYVYGYEVYDSSKNSLAYKDYGSKTLDYEYVLIDSANAAYVRFTIAKYSIDGDNIAIRKTDVSDVEVGVC